MNRLVFEYHPAFLDVLTCSITNTTTTSLQTLHCFSFHCICGRPVSFRVTTTNFLLFCEKEPTGRFSSVRCDVSYLCGSWLFVSFFTTKNFLCNWYLIDDTYFWITSFSLLFIFTVFGHSFFFPFFFTSSGSFWCFLDYLWLAMSREPLWSEQMGLSGFFAYFTLFFW